MDGKQKIANRGLERRAAPASALFEISSANASSGSFNPAVAILLAERRSEDAFRTTLEQNFSK